MDRNLAITLIEDKRLIYSYLRDLNNKRIGMLVAWKIGDEVQTSYSFVNPKDELDRLTGIVEAYKKINDNSYLLSEFKVIDADYEFGLRFLRRTIQYFKTSNVHIHLPILKRRKNE
jgi:hypothetical protein